MKSFLFAVVIGVFAPLALSQVSTTVERYGPVPAAQAYNGLGTNINPQNEWEYQAAEAAHITWGRFDCSWSTVEQQTLPGNKSGGYTLPPACTSGLTNSRNYNVHPIVDALYGPPYSAIVTGYTAAAVPVGAASIPLQVKSGSLSQVVAGQTEIALSSGYISTKHEYSGVLITGVRGSSVQLASAATVPIAEGTPITLNLLLYPPVLITQSNYRENPSVQAFGAYAHYLATQIAGFGLSGQVSIWNEPPWPDDSWDAGTRLYDNPPKTNAISPGLGVELPFYIASLPPVSGVTFDNGYTETSGWVGSFYFPNWLGDLPGAASVNKTFGTESFHPYGNNPEDSAWKPPCVVANATLSKVNGIYSLCSPAGTVIGSSEKMAVAASLFPAALGGLKHSVTETGLCRGCTSPEPTETAVTRFELRQFLTFQGEGLSPVVFYRLGDDPSFQWCTSGTDCLPVYTAFKGLMEDIGTIANAPVAAYSGCTMPEISSYSGTYPLATVGFVGAAEGAKVNSLLFYTWQRSNSTSPWANLASPAAVAVKLTIPTGMSVTEVKDVVTQQAVPYDVQMNTLVYAVADDPIEILFSPYTSTPPTISCS
jgi:hypothetical protein